VTNPSTAWRRSPSPCVGTISFNESETTTTKGRDRGGETTVSAFTFKGELFNLVIADVHRGLPRPALRPGQTKP
jgi:hypothetical protein